MRQAGTEKRLPAEQKNTATMSVTVSQDSTSEWRPSGAQVNRHDESKSVSHETEGWRCHARAKDRKLVHLCQDDASVRSQATDRSIRSSIYYRFENRSADQS